MPSQKMPKNSSWVLLGPKKYLCLVSDSSYVFYCWLETINQMSTGADKYSRKFFARCELCYFSQEINSYVQSVYYLWVVVTFEVYLRHSNASTTFGFGVNSNPDPKPNPN